MSRSGRAKAADFRALGLAPGASVDEAKAAFKKLALAHHPDKGGDPAKFREISSAFSAIAEAAGRTEEADALLADPLADVLGAGWARAFAEGSVDPMQAMDAARAKLAAEMGAQPDPLAVAAAELGLGQLSEEQLRRMVGTAGPDGADADDLAAGGAGGNMFKEFFDAMPEAERGPMMALFEKTFPAFLAAELEEQHLEAENALFAAAVERGTLRNGGAEAGGGGGGGGGGDGRAESAAQRAGREERERLAEEHNALAIEAFELERYEMAAEALGHAIALDPRNPAFYGNRSLALQRAGRHEEALVDAESCLRCDAAYAAGYERKGRALLGLEEPQAALAAFQRGLVLEAEHAGLREGAREAERAVERQRMEIMQADSEAVGGLPPGAAAATVRLGLR